MSERRSRIRTLRAAFSLVGAILQGGKGRAHESGAVCRDRQGALGEDFGPTDVYRPVAGPPTDTAVLMMHGLTKAGIDDHRIPTFAATVARGGMPVIVPEFTRMKRRLMSTKDPADVLHAARGKQRGRLPRLKREHRVLRTAEIRDLATSARCP